MLVDKSIQRAWKKSQAEANAELGKSRMKTVLIKRRRELEEERLNGLQDEVYNKQDKHLEKLERKYDIK